MESGADGALGQGQGAQEGCGVKGGVWGEYGRAWVEAAFRFLSVQIWSLLVTCSSTELGDSSMRTVADALWADVDRGARELCFRAE